MEPSEIERRLGELPVAPLEWGLKIGQPARVFYSEHLWPLLELLDAISQAGCSFCRYVEVFNASATYSLQFDGGTTLKHIDEPMSQIIESVREEIRRQSTLEVPYADPQETIDILL